MEDYAILIILFLMAVCLLILTVIGYWGVFCKAGEKGWKVLIPFYNEYLLFKIAWKPSICLFKWLCLFLYEVVSVTLNTGSRECSKTDAHCRSSFDSIDNRCGCYSVFYHQVKAGIFKKITEGSI